MPICHILCLKTSETTTRVTLTTTTIKTTIPTTKTTTTTKMTSRSTTITTTKMTSTTCKLFETHLIPSNIIRIFKQFLVTERKCGLYQSSIKASLTISFIMICFDLIGIFLDGIWFYVRDCNFYCFEIGAFFILIAPYLLNLTSAFCFLAFYYKS